MGNRFMLFTVTLVIQVDLCEKMAAVFQVINPFPLFNCAKSNQ